MSWSGFNNGTTLGLRGSESGIVMADEEHSGGARITLEREGKTAPFAITCGVYGWMVHTRFFGTEEEGRGEYAAMRVGLAELASLPVHDESDFPKMIQAIRAFVDRFP